MNEELKLLWDGTCPPKDNATSSLASEVGPLPCALPAGPKIGPSGPALAPASPSRQRVKAKVKPIAAIFGQSSSDLSERLARQLFSGSRSRPPLDLDGSTDYSMTWKAKDTPAGRSYFQLVASARRTSGSGCTGWPTATKNDSTGSCYQYSSGNHEKPVLKLPGAVKLAGWVSPAETTWGGSAEAHLERKRRAIAAGAKMGLVVSCLDQQVTLAGWMSPRAKGDAGGSRFEKGEVANLEDQVKTSGPPPASYHARTGRKGVLDHRFSLWLMGFPAVWASLAPNSKDWLDWQGLIAQAYDEQSPIESAASKAPETPSCQSRPPSS